MTVTARLLALACCVCLAGSSPLVAADIVSLDGKTVQGTVVGVDADSVSVKDADGKVTKLPVKALAEVRLGNAVVAAPPGEVYDEIELTDGSLLRVSNKDTVLKKTDFAVAPAVEVKALAAPKFTVPLKTAFYWLRKANGPGVRGDWKLKVVEKRGKRDFFVLYSPDAGFDPLDGTVLGGSDDGDKIFFETAGGQREEYGRAKLTGGLLLVQPSEAVLPPTAGRVFDVYGNVLLATAMTIDEKSGAVTVTTVSGAKAEYAAVAALARVDFAQGNVKPLDELEVAVDAPPAADGVPYQPYLIGKTREGSGLRVGGKPYTRGVWVAPDSTLKYKLGGNYREFKAVVGIDDSVPVLTSDVTLVVEVDGNKVLTHKFVSDPKAKKPLELNLNVKDAKELKITVDRAALFSGEGLAFADAKLQK